MNKLEMHGRTVQIIAWISGLSVIEYPIGRQRPVISFLYLMIIMGTFGYAVISLMDCANSNVLASRFSEKISLISFLGGIVYSYYVLGSVWLFRKEETKCLRRLNEVTELIVSIGSEVDFKNTKRNKMIQIIFLAICAQEIVFSSLKDPNLELFSTFNKIFINIYLRILILYNNLIFINYLRIIELNFAKINKKLKELSTLTDCSSSSMSIYEIIKSISRIKQLHLQLTRVSRSFNDLYGIRILLSVTLNFAASVLYLYIAYCTVYNVAFDLMTLNYQFIRSCLLMSFHLYVIVIVNDACSSTAMEASKIGCRIFELSNGASSTEIDSEIERFFMQLHQNLLEFTVHGFFVLNRGITFDIIMALISYLIVLVQLSTCQV